MKDSPLSTQQGAVSKPVIQGYVNRILASETDIPAIKVDNGIIVDGNHRYIAGRITGVEVPTFEWSGGRTGSIVDWLDITIDTFD